MRLKSVAKRKIQAKEILNVLDDVYGKVDCSLSYANDPWRLLVGAILAAQCTDARVNMVTPALFEAYPSIESMANASILDVEKYIHSVGFFRNKAKGIVRSANIIMDEFNGVVPNTEEDLLKLAGVGRKIANLLIGDIYGGQAIVVDTHCLRISKLLGLTNNQTPPKVEKDLMKVIPHDRWTDWGHLMVEHGRAVCVARRPKCVVCPILTLCDTGKEKQLEE